MRSYSFFHNGFTFFLLSAAIVTIGAPLMQNGVFMDAMLYKTVAHNFASGAGTFWRMKFTDVSMNPFYEQPPLFFCVTGVWYKLFGESLVSDRAFTLLCLVISVFLIHRLCRRLLNEDLTLTVFFFLLCIPVVHWTFVNQVIETLVTPLSLLAFLLASERPATTRKAVFNGFLFLLALVFLFLSKGFQSCFVIVTPFLFFIYKKEKHFLVTGAVASVLLFAALCILLFAYQPSADWFNVYLEKRLKASLEGVGATTTYRAEILVRIVTEFMLPLIILAGSVWVYRKKYKAPENNTRRENAWVLLITGLCGTVPYAITLEQRGFYLVPAFPFLVLALAAFAEKPLARFQNAVRSFLSSAIPGTIVVCLLAGSVVYMVYSPMLFKREETLITELEKMSPYFHAGDTLSIDEEMWNYTTAHAFIYMRSGTNLSDKEPHRYYLRDESHQTPVKPGYEEVPLGTNHNFTGRAGHH